VALLGVICLGATAGIILTVVALTPLDEIDSGTVAASGGSADALPPSAMKPMPAARAAEPSIRLHETPAEATAEQLRAEAEQLAERLLDQHPDRADALHVVALLYRDLQKTTEAEKIWEKCIRLAPTHTGPYIGLATAAMELGKDETAVQTLRQALDAGCSTSDLYYQLGTALTKLGRLEEAAATIQTGLAAFPESSESWLQLGQVQLQLAEVAQAEESLHRALSAGTDSESVYFALATACARQGKQEEATRYREEFQRRRTQREAESDARFQDRYSAEMRRIAVATLAKAGAVYEQQGDAARAEKLLLRAQHLDPLSLAVCGELALFYRRQQRPADALVVQRHLAEVDPGNALHFSNLASLAMHLGEYALAETALRRVIQMRPDASIGYSGLAQLYLQTDNIEQARWFAEAALRQKPATADEVVRISLVLAAACQRLGDAQAAAAALEAARQVAPDDPRLVPPEAGASPPGAAP
jgi:tetratricopeptide (TPR) repeat protein